MEQLVTELHRVANPHVLVFTGGGASAAGWLLSVPGGSRTILEVIIPYAESALVQFLGRKPASACSADTARLLAWRAWERARWLVPDSEERPVVGCACTASLRSDRPKRGDHRFHIALTDGQRVLTWSLTLLKDARSRAEEEEVLDCVLLNALAEMAGLSQRVSIPLRQEEQVLHGVQHLEGPLSRFLAGALDAVCVEPDGRVCEPGGEKAVAPGLLLPGSFNPLHEGHLELAAVATQHTGRPANFEITITNADKPSLPEPEVRRRLAMFTWRGRLWLTRAPTFPEKSALFPHAIFVVGSDTAERIVQPRFYNDSVEQMQQALQLFRSRGCRFLVAGRLIDGRGFVRLSDLDIPTECADLFEELPESAFRVDISSTQLRGQ